MVIVLKVRLKPDTTFVGTKTTITFVRLKPDTTFVSTSTDPSTVPFCRRSPPPYPHSFPTPRSSALQTGWTREQLLSRLCTEKLGLPADARSEEHTSELQSQSKLVCRLLLEKKIVLSENWR